MIKMRSLLRTAIRLRGPGKYIRVSEEKIPSVFSLSRNFHFHNVNEGFVNSWKMSRKVSPIAVNNMGGFQWCLCGFTSESGVEDKDDENGDDDGDEFAELDMPPQERKANDDDGGDDKVRNKTTMFMAVMKHNPRELREALEQWLKEGNIMDEEEVRRAVSGLRKVKLYSHGLEVLNWLRQKGQFEFSDREYGSLVYFISKVEGLAKAEKYIESLSPKLRGRQVYESLLATVDTIQEAEMVCKRMKNSGLGLNISDYNRLLRLYGRYRKDKIVDVLNRMEIDGVEPDCLTYKILLDAKGKLGDISSMEMIVEKMKSEGIDLDGTIQITLSKWYIKAGMTDKAKLALKEAEKFFEKDKYLVPQILILYAALNETTNIQRLCQEIENINNNRIRQKCYVACIKSWGMVGEIEKAELVLEKIASSTKLSSKHYCQLLGVYVEKSLLHKAEELVKKMVKNGDVINWFVWQRVFGMYLKQNEIEKADSALSKALRSKEYKPAYQELLTMLKKYAEKGNIAKAEKYFQILRQAGYAGKFPLYENLLQAYINANAPAYGFTERIMADKFIPNSHIKGLLDKLEMESNDPIQKIFER